MFSTTKETSRLVASGQKYLSQTTTPQKQEATYTYHSISSTLNSEYIHKLKDYATNNSALNNAAKKIATEAENLLSKNPSEDEKIALNKSLQLSIHVMESIKNTDIALADKQKAIQALHHHAHHHAHGKSNRWEQFKGAVGAFVGLAIVAAGIVFFPLTYGVSSLGSAMGAGLFYVSKQCFDDNKQKGLSLAMTHLKTEATPITNRV